MNTFSIRSINFTNLSFAMIESVRCRYKIKTYCLIILLAVTFISCSQKNLIENVAEKNIVEMSADERRFYFTGLLNEQQYDKIEAFLLNELKISKEKIFDDYKIADMLADLYLFKMANFTKADHMNEEYKKYISIPTNQNVTNQEALSVKYHFRKIYLYELMQDSIGISSYLGSKIYQKYQAARFAGNTVRRNQKQNELYIQYKLSVQYFNTKKYQDSINIFEDLLLKTKKTLFEIKQSFILKRFEAIKFANRTATDLEVAYKGRNTESLLISLTMPWTVLATIPILLTDNINSSLSTLDIRTQYERDVLLVFDCEESKELNYFLNPIECMEYFYIIGCSYEKLKNNGKAIDFYKKSISILENIRSSIELDRQKISYFADKIKIYNLLITLLMKENRLEEAFTYIDRSKSRALVDQMATRWLSRNNTKDAKQIKEEFAKVRLFVEQTATTDSQLRSANFTISSNSTSHATSFDKLRSISFVESVPFGMVKKWLFDSTILQYLYEDNRLFVVGYNSVNGFFGKIQQVNSDELERDINVFLGEIRGFSGYTNTKLLSVAEKLFSLLFNGIDKKLTKHLIIIPHKKLFHLPFNALICSGLPLIYKHSVSTLPSATIVKFFSNPKKFKDILLVGNVSYNKLPLLSFTEVELRNIATLFERNYILDKEKTTKLNFIEYIGKTDILHFAGHSHFDQNDPFNSGIILSEAGNDYIITGYDLLNINFNSQLITISSCESGLNQILTGGELLGLSRPILMAGVRNLVGSLWQVEDESTMNTMVNFYRQLVDDDLKSNFKVAESLRKAQVLMYEKFKFPFLWASFYVTGLGY